ncbi:phage portal protein [Nonomuraea sp. NPDC059007]|uniref:phage portal protein n=1 Tax=Nonomuraea sp. NPDC059007 TaxID=3346692 RepID=UPI00367ACA40
MPTPGITSAPVTPIEWITWLEGRLTARASQVRKYRTYYDAEETTLGFAQTKFKEEFGYLFREWRDNFCSIVVDSLSERLTVQGFRLGDDPEADSDAHEIWQRNFLDADSNAAHIEALTAGESYLAVWGHEDTAKPIITPETADEVVVQYAPGSRRKLDAALKRYWDDWGTEHVTLWTPKLVYTAQRGSTYDSWTEPRPAKNPLGVVPIVPLVNRQRLGRKKPFSEIAPIVPLQDAVSKIAADAIVASEFGAYPQRILSGIEIPEDEDGNPVAPIKAAIDRMLLFEDENVKWGQFAAAELQNYVHLINLFVQHISTISRTPPHYLLVNGGQAPSGESIQSAEAGLVAKARERMLHFGESWETAMRLAFLVKGDKAKAEAWQAETIWADPEFRSEAQRADAMVKRAQGLGVPQRQLWEDAGYTPQQIARFEDMQDEEFKRKLDQQKQMTDAMPQPAMPGAPGAAGKPAPKGQAAAMKKPQGNSGNNARKIAA